MNADDRHYYTDHTWCHANSELFIFQTAGQIDGMSCARCYHEGARADQREYSSLIGRH
jgi:hypothetical protein